MTKELLIVFVYDYEQCQKEEDDPQNAIIYFYPSWVSEQQRLALCGQLMGVSKFFSTTLSQPNIISLQTGRFAIRSLGKFLLCVGTDRNLPDLVLDTRMKTLYRLIQFYHKDFEKISNLANEKFVEKTAEILEVYLPVLQCAGNIFGSIHTFNLPKSASTVFLQAIQILQCFQAKAGVLGGVILHKNKVIASQISADLTKLLVLSEPQRIKLPGEAAQTEFQLPVGVQLLKVYMEPSELTMLETESSQLSVALKSSKQWQRDSCSLDQELSRKKSNKDLTSAFAMKRDISRIFPVMEEVEGEAESERVPDIVRDAVKARKAAQILKVAQVGSVIPDPIFEKQAQTTDNVTDFSTSKITIRYLSVGNNPREEGNGEPEVLRPYYNTISDATFPKFRTNGLPASVALYNTRLAHHYCNLSDDSTNLPNKKPHLTEQQAHSSPVKLHDTNKKEHAKRALNLPLASTTTNTNDKAAVAESGLKRTCNSIPLTPLMAKLSLLAQEQKGEMTPSLPPLQINRKSKSRHQRRKSQCEELQDKVLYVCGVHDMTLFLIMNSEASHDPDNIHSLWETSVSCLGELENMLHHYLENFSGSAACESYSFLSVDPEWGMSQRCGAWAGSQLELLTEMHHHFNTCAHLTETTVRTEDSIIYGSQCGKVEVFYQQGCSEGSVTGLPAPSDLMGVVALKAKRRLERDHGIILL